MIEMRLTLARMLCPATHLVVPREPSQAMRRAACRAMSPAARRDKPWVSNSEKHAIRYRAMIDAYLKEIAA